MPVHPGGPAARSDTWVVIPAMNEQQVIAGTVSRLAEHPYEILVVDDGSTDGTWEILSKLPVHRLRHPVNLGQGAALQTGVAHALARGARYIVHFDADGQHQPEDIAAMLAPLSAGEADVVLGSRFLCPEHARKVPLLRRVLLRTARIVNFVFTGLWLSDAHNGFRAMTRSAAERIELKEDGFAHATEILTHIRRQRLRYVERPTNVHYTDYSQAKGQKLSNALNILLDLVLGRVFR